MMNNSSDLLDHDDFLVFGAARSGLAAANLLLSRGKRVVVYDEADPSRLQAARKQLDEWGVPLVSKLDLDTFPMLEMEDSDGAMNPWNFQVLVLSPGIPATHPLVQLAEETGCVVRSEIEVGYLACPAPFAAITGTNGKTTVTHLLSHLFTHAGWFAPLAGNVGNALCGVVQDPRLREDNAVVVCEVSSFQLESIEHFRPRTACVLNITPDHLDRYPSMQHYVEAKYSVTENQLSGDHLILNNDDPYCLSFEPRTAAKLWKFSVRGPVSRGAFLQGDTLFLATDKAEPMALLERKSIPLPGLHNVQNVLAALAMGASMGLAPRAMAEAVQAFQAVPHRIEWIATIDGVDYYNDSKATNLDSLEKALESFERPIVLIAGGRDKGAPWTRLNDIISKKVRALVLIGEAAPIGRTAWAERVEVCLEAQDMEKAVGEARHLARPGDIILLSPACASYDMYQSFEQRGDDFRQVVKQIEKKESL
ncbi:UDP-N-acetylmuramoyl-L-alanine--D-glutamate ligase [bacterium]|nr:UDP-N-acetylmuramoyl-L-alanine--D-glutamate ligase [bacterium]